MRIAAVWLVLISLSALTVRAQAPGGGNANLPIPWRQQVFSIPFQITRPLGQADSPTEVQLYLSVDQGQTWRLAQKVHPQAGKFTFKAHADGEYWFAMRTLGANGLFLENQQLSPGLRVFVDTSAPLLQLQGQRGRNGEVELYWQVVDAGMDAKSLKLEYQTAPNEAWRPLSVSGMQAGNKPGSYVGKATFSGGLTAGDITVRAEVADVAGNRTVSQARIPADGTPGTSTDPAVSPPNGIASAANATLQPNGVTSGNPAGISASNQPGNSQGGTQNPFQQTANSPGPNPTGQTQGNPTQSNPSNSNLAQGQSGGIPNQGERYGEYQNNLPNGASNNIANNNAANHYGNSPRHISQDDAFVAKPATPQAWPADRVAQVPLERSGPLAPDNERYFAQRGGPPPANQPVYRTPNDSANRYGQDGTTSDPAGGNYPQTDSRYQFASEDRAAAEVHSPAPYFELPKGAKVRMVNSPAFELQYDVASVGPSGVARVELWGTRDGGKSWSLFGEDPDRQSPVPAEVKFDGIYGFRIVVHAGSGKSSPLPQTGDAPEVWVGVDLKMPTGEILAVEPGENDINIRWTTADDYPAAKPVSLAYGPTPNGPWTSITTGQRNQGAYTWQPNREVPEEVYIQLQAADEAGNVMTTVSRQSVALPHHRPQGRIRDVQPIAPSASRGGNWFR